MTPSKPLHFLLVEDDEDHANLVRMAMEENRVANTFEHVADGEAALAYLRGEPPYEQSPRPDVILLDLRLPKLDGHEVLQAVKHDAATQTIPVVVLTSSSAEADRARAYLDGVNSYLTKPLDFEQFNQMIRDLKYYWTVWNQPPAPMPSREID